MKHLVAKPMRQGATIRFTEQPHDPRRRVMVWFKPDLPLSVPIGVHSNCQCNEVVALRNRVLQSVPPMTAAGYLALKPIMSNIAAYLGKHTPAEGKWILAYPGAKKSRYLRARQEVLHRGLVRSDGYLNSFVKSERLMDASKDPRLIQARSAKYNYALGNYLKPIEHLLYNVQGKGPLKPWFPRGRLIAKGLCQRRRANLLKSKMESIPHAVVISLDCSRFDAHVTPEALALEHAVYLKCYNNDPYLRKLLGWQMDNVGFTQNRVRYKCKGGRSSGDMNTALGNCVLMIAMVAAAMRTLGFTTHQWQVLDDGDDCLLIIPAALEHKLSNISALFRGYGHELKLENRAVTMEDVVFCQSRPVRCEDGWRFVRDPTKTLSTSFIGIKHYQTRSGVAKLMRMIGECELALSAGVPVLDAYAKALLRCTPGVKPLNDPQSGLWMKASREIRWMRGKPLPIVDTEARISFNRAYGIDGTLQLAYESWFDSLTPGDLWRETYAETSDPFSTWHPINAQRQLSRKQAPRSRGPNLFGDGFPDPLADRQ